jgi:hypothetical protein
MTRRYSTAETMGQTNSCTLCAALRASALPEQGAENGSGPMIEPSGRRYVRPLVTIGSCDQPIAPEFIDRNTLSSGRRR